MDQQGYENIAAGAAKVQQAIDRGQWVQATNAWGSLEGTVSVESYDVDFYNILYKIYYRYSSNKKAQTPLRKLK